MIQKDILLKNSKKILNHFNSLIKVKCPGDFVGDLTLEKDYEILNNDKPITFFTSVTGDQFTKTYLGVLLQSIYDLYETSCNIAVSFSDVSNNIIREFHAKMPHARWLKSKKKWRAKLQRDRAAQKLQAGWTPFVSRVENDFVVLMDADMLVLRDICPFFEEQFDIGYTYFDNHVTDFGDVSTTKSGKHIRLNTGIILIKNIQKARPFFEQWTNTTVNLLKANRLDLIEEWGAADQAALAHILKTDDHSKPVFLNNIILKGFPCRFLNEAECVPVTDNSYVIHYKGRWRPILPDGNFNRLSDEQKKTRNKKICYEQYLIWKEFYNRWNRK
jgi:hypothetical protein